MSTEPDGTDGSLSRWMNTCGDVVASTVLSWISVKAKWRLTITASEKAALSSMLATC